MPGKFWRDCMWSFGQLLLQYDSQHLYSILNQRYLLSLVLNVSWVSNDPEDRWVCWLHSVCSVQLYYKLRVYAWLAIYLGIPSTAQIPSKARLDKSGFSDGLCPIWHHSQRMKDIFWEYQFSKHCWRYIEDQYSVLVQGSIHWCSALFGDFHSPVCTFFSGT